MSLANFPLAGAAIGQAAALDENKSKAPPKRQALARADAAVVPEPR